MSVVHSATHIVRMMAIPLSKTGQKMVMTMNRLMLAKQIEGSIIKKTTRVQLPPRMKFVIQVTKLFLSKTRTILKMKIRIIIKSFIISKEIIRQQKM
ncbi:Protein CBG27739 [Caenorhabditis briggsae]|uniref:Protein CBG27739 n=1 Tax=Caenorhabditis briggsae TaxID=6238 RepID=B6IJ37_CAEBR|nr:Protein CBG27739 [Caenorhabditis briggsae]CAS00017.1 Protein CBG27739 [Caenorhabditis briggsae]